MIDYVTLVILSLLTLVLYLFLNQNSNYWKNLKVPSVPPVPLLGNLKSLLFLEKSLGQFVADLYRTAEILDERFLGIYLLRNQPALIVRDPELIKDICVRNFQHFTNRNMNCDEKIDPLGFNNLFVLSGGKWKFLRSKLTSNFTSGKMKQMFLLVKDVANDLVEYLESSLQKNKEDEKPSVIFESKHLLAKYSVDVISSCAFGIKSNCIANEKSQFGCFADLIFKTTLKRAYEWRAFFFVHWMVKILGAVMLQKDSCDFFRKVFAETISKRETEKIFRNDFLDNLIQLKNEQKKKLENNSEESKEDMFVLDEDLLLAQPVLFFTAGFESSSTVTSMALYELALQPYLQEKLRTEILETIKAHNGELTYDGIREMTYLEMVVSETLRKYPPLPFLDRMCTLDYEIPDSNVVIKKGTPIYIPIYKGVHYDSKHYSMPEKFDPERFTAENKEARHPFSYIPFGEGPRSCIGMRLGQIIAKAGLCAVLSHFRVEICEKTQVPLQMNNRSVMLSTKKGCYLKYVKL